MKERIIEFDWRGDHFEEPLPERLRVEVITPEQVREALNQAPDNYAYWAGLQAEISKEVSALETKYEIWYAKVYSVVDAESSRKTEAWKKNRVIIEYEGQIKKYHKKLHELNRVKGKIAALVKAYDMQSRVQQTIASLLRTEMSMYAPEAKGSRNLKEE